MKRLIIICGCAIYVSAASGASCTITTVAASLCRQCRNMQWRILQDNIFICCRTQNLFLPIELLL